MITNFIDYRLFLRSYIQSLPKRGRGEISRLATLLDVNSTMISQVLKGTKKLTQEQVYNLSVYLKLTDFQTEYFMMLLQVDRAGSEELRRFWSERVFRLKRSQKNELFEISTEALEA